MAASTITVTFGGQVENHVGMEKIGQMAEHGYTVDELKDIAKIFRSMGFTVEIIDLNSYINIDSASASVLIIREGIECFLSQKDDLFQEQLNLNWDTKAFMRGRVVNKHARYNLCYTDFSQEPEYDEGKGRVISFSEMPLLSLIRGNLHDYFGKKAKNLLAEGNYYYEASKCGIGYHGDSERKIVIAIRLGASMDLHYKWFHQGKSVGKECVLTLNHGDMYVMSEKATGFDWKRKVVPTLRHSAGAAKYTVYKK